MRTIPFLFARLQLLGCCKKVKEFLVIGYFASEKDSHYLQRARILKNKLVSKNTLPEISSDVKLDEIYVFMGNGKWKIGKVLQFSKLSVSGRQFKESTARISSDIGVVCSWFELLSGSENVFQLCSENDRQNTVHYYITLSDYHCMHTYKQLHSTCSTLCWHWETTTTQINDKEGNGNTSILHVAANQQVMMTTDCLRLSDSYKSIYPMLYLRNVLMLVLTHALEVLSGPQLIKQI